jgi:hypothetical protein
MTIQHKNIPNADLHEPKGVSLATSNTVYVANGSGSGTWVKTPTQALAGISTNGSAGQLVAVNGSGAFSLASAPHGNIYFFDSTTPTVVTTPLTPTKVLATTVGSGVSTDISEGTTAIVTYTGTSNTDLCISYTLALDQTTGTNREVTSALYKNGSLLSGSQTLSTVQNGSIHSLSSTINNTAATNDYYEVYVTLSGGSGNVRVYSLQLNVILAGV